MQCFSGWAVELVVAIVFASVVEGGDGDGELEGTVAKVFNRTDFLGILDWQSLGCGFVESYD